MSRPLVLIAEDDEHFATELEAFFASHGWDTEVVADGLQVLGRLRSEPRPSLLCLDLSLPTVDGWSLYAELRRNRAFPEIPIVVVTATRALEDEQLAGIRAFLRKPGGSVHAVRYFEDRLRSVIAMLPPAA